MTVDGDETSSVGSDSSRGVATEEEDAEEDEEDGLDMGSLMCVLLISIQLSSTSFDDFSSDVLSLLDHAYHHTSSLSCF